jgi:hypothetical protein
MATCQDLDRHGISKQADFCILQIISISCTTSVSTTFHYGVRSGKSISIILKAKFFEYWITNDDYFYSSAKLKKRNYFEMTHPRCVFHCRYIFSNSVSAWLILKNISVKKLNLIKLYFKLTFKQTTKRTKMQQFCCFETSYARLRLACRRI